jgi:hypothetical protein
MQFTGNLHQLLSERQLAILVNENNYNGSFEFKQGSNVEVTEFVTTPDTASVGMYVTNIDTVICAADKYMCKFAYVKIPDDARICVCEQNGVEWYRVDKCIVTSDFHHVQSYYKFTDYNFCKEAVRKNPKVMTFIENKTEELYQIAIESDDGAIMDIPVEHRTFAICMQVVKKNCLQVSMLKSKAMSPKQYLEVWFEAAKGNCNVIDWAPYDWRPILWRRYNEL